MVTNEISSHHMHGSSDLFMLDIDRVGRYETKFGVLPFIESHWEACEGKSIDSYGVDSVASRGEGFLL